MTTKEGLLRLVSRSEAPRDTAMQGCIEVQRLFELAGTSLDKRPDRLRNHIEGCPKCAAQFMVFRSAKLLSDLPSRWTVHLGNAIRTVHLESSEETFQILGTISFLTREFGICHEEEWLSSPLAMRVNIVLNAAMGFFSLTILDAPLGIESLAIMTPAGLQPLRCDNASDVFELLLCSGDDTAAERSLVSFAELHKLVTAHKLQLDVTMKYVADRSPGTEANDIIELLEHHQAIERCADYVLPCGLHSDTYINVSALCSCEDTMQLVAAKTDFLFWDTHFDTVLANGWAMAMIGRRLAAARQAQGRTVPIRQALCEGYEEPVLLDDVIPGSQVLILLDVVVSGRLACKLQRLVEAVGGNVVGIAVLVRPHGATPLEVANLRTLCEVEMELIDAQRASCPRCGVLARRVFNPIAGCMTTRSTVPRSPSEFLNGDPIAREMWSYIHSTGAYEHHRREGDTHYIGFVDTRKLLEAREIGKRLVDRLVDATCKSGGRPTFLLVPNRSRACLFAAMMSRAFDSVIGIRPKLLTATRKWTTGKWELMPDEYVKMHNADVLIVDTAAGHGRTIDQLATLAAKANARRVGASVLLSRLAPPCEDAFNLRLSGGFRRLFNLPIRPVAIRGDRKDLCPVCRRKNAIRRFAEDSDIEALEEWADGLLKMHRAGCDEDQRRKHKQLLLFDEEPFLSGCGAAVASGITLHALGAASTNGSAPLSLPELFDERIPWRARASMVENLPAGVLEWAGNTLVSDLLNLLSKGGYPSIWKAAANLLSREGNDLWLDHFESMLNRLSESNHRISQSFWNHMACNAYLLAAGGGDARDSVLARINELLSHQTDDMVQNGLRQMQDVIRG